jgi:hypothetical protein
MMGVEAGKFNFKTEIGQSAERGWWGCQANIVHKKPSDA